MLIDINNYCVYTPRLPHEVDLLKDLMEVMETEFARLRAEEMGKKLLVLLEPGHFLRGCGPAPEEFVIENVVNRAWFVQATVVLLATCRTSAVRFGELRVLKGPAALDETVGRLVAAARNAAETLRDGARRSRGPFPADAARDAVALLSACRPFLEAALAAPAGDGFAAGIRASFGLEAGENIANSGVPQAAAELAAMAERDGEDGRG